MAAASGPKLKFSGKAAIVTGSTSGIGLAVAEAFAREGANVIVSGSRASDSEGAAEAVKQVQEAGGDGVRVVYVQADLRSPEPAAKSLIDTCVKEFGSVHILVNNAGIQHVCSTDDFPVEKWDDLIAVNLTAVFHTTQKALPHMKKNEGKWGRIVNVSSVHGVVASVNKPAYCASKHGVNGLTKVVALENAADTGITCNSVCPGWVLTPLVEKQIQVRLVGFYESQRGKEVGGRGKKKGKKTLAADFLSHFGYPLSSFRYNRRAPSKRGSPMKTPSRISSEKSNQPSVLQPRIKLRICVYSWRANPRRI
jgi:3-hydroxybutyrate dehydrogenase